jgi:diguanylate cyclase (GGDEF)-like protein
MKFKELVEFTAKNIGVLVAEDSRPQRKFIVNLLKKLKIGKIYEAENGKEAIEVFTNHKREVHLAVLDWIMPKASGLEVCEKIREEMTDHYVYIIFLSAVEDRDKIAEALQKGADDFITKPFYEKEFLARVRAGLRIIALEEALNRMNKTLRRLAVMDELTGTLNRRALIDSLRRELIRADREGKFFSLLMIDVDHFKKINDTFGHQVGDRVLRELAKLLKTNCRKYDIIGRYGGEEFVVAFSTDFPLKAFLVGERIRKAVENHRFTDNLKVTISVGAVSEKVSLKGKHPMKVLEQIIKKADTALYSAKESGRNRVIYAGELTNEGSDSAVKAETR